MWAAELITEETLERGNGSIHAAGEGVQLACELYVVGGTKIFAISDCRRLPTAARSISADVKDTLKLFVAGVKRLNLSPGRGAGGDTGDQPGRALRHQR